MLRVVRAFQEIQHVQLPGKFRHAGRNVMVLVQNQVGILRAVSVWSDLTSVNWTFCVREQRTTCKKALWLHVSSGCCSIRALLNVPRSETVVQQNRFQPSLKLYVFIIGGHKHELICNSISSNVFAWNEFRKTLIRFLINSRCFWVSLPVREIPRPGWRHVIIIGLNNFFLVLDFAGFFYR